MTVAHRAGSTQPQGDQQGAGEFTQFICLESNCELPAKGPAQQESRARNEQNSGAESP